MDSEFFKETYPVALLFGGFILALFLNLIAWLEVGPDVDAYEFIPQGFMFRGGGRGAVMHLFFKFIAKHPMLYRLLATTALGVLPVYLRLSYDNEKHKTALFVLLGLYLLWIIEKLIRVGIDSSKKAKA